MKDGATPLYVAAQEAQLEVCKWLTQNGADVNTPDKVSALLFLQEEEGLTRKMMT